MRGMICPFRADRVGFNVSGTLALCLALGPPIPMAEPPRDQLTFERLLCILRSAITMLLTCNKGSTGSDNVMNDLADQMATLSANPHRTPATATSPFLQLPQELRDMIYAYVCAPIDVVVKEASPVATYHMLPPRLNAVC